MLGGKSFQKEKILFCAQKLYLGLNALNVGYGI